jgi:hypothetical protein
LPALLEAKQGVGKTNAARILAGGPDRILDQPIMHKDAREQQEALLGKIIYEIAEMEDMRKADVGAIKAFISRTHDRARGAYRHSPRNQPRRCIYIGTTNETEYLPDEENRRFYPVKVGVADEAGIRRCRDQMHAEAVVAWRNGESSTPQKELWDAARKEQRKRRISDPWEDVIGDALRKQIGLNAKLPKGTGSEMAEPNGVREIDHKGRKVWFVPSAMIMSNVLGISTAQQHGLSGRRARAVMARLAGKRRSLELTDIRRAALFMISRQGGSPQASGTSTGTRSMRTTKRLS